MNASKVNEFFHDCIITCTATRETMFLRPSTKSIPQCYEIKWVSSGALDARRYRLALYQYPSRLSKPEGTYPSIKTIPRDLIRGVCPYLRLAPEDHLDNRAHYEGALDSSEDDKLRFTAHPNTMERFPDMLLADPPRMEAIVELFYKWPLQNQARLSTHYEDIAGECQPVKRKRPGLGLP
jgi:hypothetical protein